MFIKLLCKAVFIFSRVKCGKGFIQFMNESPEFTYWKNPQN